MAKCSIIWDPKVSAYKLHMPFNSQIVNFLKSQIPHSDRKWDPDIKQWTFTEQYFDGTKQLCELCFGAQEVACVTKEQYEQAQAKANRQPISMKSSPIGETCYTFLTEVGYDAAKQAYRKAALMYHPDLIKDTPELKNKMAQINTLWTRIEKEVFKK